MKLIPPDPPHPHAPPDPPGSSPIMYTSVPPPKSTLPATKSPLTLMAKPPSPSLAAHLENPEISRSLQPLQVKKVTATADPSNAWSIKANDIDEVITKLVLVSIKQTWTLRGQNSLIQIDVPNRDRDAYAFQFMNASVTIHTIHSSFRTKDRIRDMKHHITRTLDWDTLKSRNLYYDHIHMPIKAILDVTNPTPDEVFLSTSSMGKQVTNMTQIGTIPNGSPLREFLEMGTSPTAAYLQADSNQHYIHQSGHGTQAKLHDGETASQQSQPPQNQAMAPANRAPHHP